MQRPGEQGPALVTGHLGQAAVEDVPNFKDVTPRVGVAYDVFGNGRTAVKMNIGRYLEGVGVQLNYANTNPTTRIPTNVD